MGIAADYFKQKQVLAEAEASLTSAPRLWRKLQFQFLADNPMMTHEEICLHLCALLCVQRAEVHQLQRELVETKAGLARRPAPRIHVPRMGN
jgi:hypothetical protein